MTKSSKKWISIEELQEIEELKEKYGEKMTFWRWLIIIIAIVLLSLFSLLGGTGIPFTD